MKSKPCKHRIDKDICMASAYTNYDEIYECKHAKKECPYYEEQGVE